MFGHILVEWPVMVLGSPLYGLVDLGGLVGCLRLPSQRPWRVGEGFWWYFWSLVPSYVAKREYEKRGKNTN